MREHCTREFDPSIVLTPEQVAWEKRLRLIAKGGEVRRAQGTVYFMTCGSYVKIGVSIRPETRRKALEACSPHNIEIIATMPGGITKERELHRKFKSCHHRLEWFIYGYEIRRYLEGLKR